MTRRKSKQAYIEDSVDSILQLEEPAAVDVEKNVLRLVLSGKCEKEIFAGLDANCFYIPDHSAMFAAAKELYDEFGTVPGGRFCEKIGASPEKVKEYLSDSSPFPDHLDYQIKILQYMKLRRAVVWESVTMIANAMDEHYYIDDLVDDCEKYSERVKSRGVTRIKDPNMEDWYALGGDPSAEKYLVKKGKNGWSDYCVVDNKFVSETQMINRGFKRISLPIERKEP
jgi:hypothetical protein